MYTRSSGIWLRYFRFCMRKRDLKAAMEAIVVAISLKSPKPLGMPNKLSKEALTELESFGPKSKKLLSALLAIGEESEIELLACLQLSLGVPNNCLFLMRALLSKKPHKQNWNLLVSITYFTMD
eukprot:Filipodium_phascolosomae@DN6232_c0_g1_i1.p1